MSLPKSGTKKETCTPLTVAAAEGLAGQQRGQAGGHAHYHAPLDASGRTPWRLWVKGAHLGVFQRAPVALLGLSLETGRVGQRSDRPHHGRPEARLRVQVEGVPWGAVEELELNPVCLIEQRGSGGVLNQRQVVPRVVLLENRFPKSNKQYDEGDDDEDHQRDADQLFLVDHGVSRLHVRDEDAAQAAALAHVARRAVAVEGAISVDAHAAVLTLPPRIRRVALVYVVPATAEREKRGWGVKGCDRRTGVRLERRRVFLTAEL